MHHQPSKSKIEMHVKMFLKIAKNGYPRPKKYSNDQNKFTTNFNSQNCQSQVVSSFYDIAKQFQTKHRNLEKALQFYTKAALNGEKINTCIKDFASVLHQSGNTSLALQFLESMKHVYTGQFNKYKRLIENLKQQINPTGRHEYKNLLIDLRDLKIDKQNNTLIQEMFSNISRAKQINVYPDLSFSPSNSNSNRYILLSFGSFSAAKKTLQTFDHEEWFGVDKYWVDTSFNIICEAIDGKCDFDRGLLFKDGKIQRFQGDKVDENFIDSFQLPKFTVINGTLRTQKKLQYNNNLSIYLIQHQKSQQTKQRLIKKGIWQPLK